MTDLSSPAFPGEITDFYGYACHNFELEGRQVRVVEPTAPLPSRPWIWRTMYWEAFPGVQLALLERGYHVAHIEIGKTFASTEALKPFDTFYELLTEAYSLSPRPVLEGLSLGGLYAYRWGHANPDKVGSIYGDAPLCDLKCYPGSKDKRRGNEADWQRAMDEYKFATDEDFLNFRGNPVDTLAPLVEAKVPIVHVVGDVDEICLLSENSDVIHERYMKMGGNMLLVVKQGCAHHPHGLADPTPVVDYIMACTAGGDAAIQAAKTAPPHGTVLNLSPGEW